MDEDCISPMIEKLGSAKNDMMLLYVIRTCVTLALTCKITKDHRGHKVVFRSIKCD